MTDSTNANDAGIVVIDDDPEILELVALILSRKKFNVLTATDATSGLALIAQNHPEIVLMDYMMPDMDGLKALKVIKTTYPDSYVIMFTGKGNEEIAVELMKAGASEYLLKPFNNRTLVERIENVLRLREIELSNRALQAERERLLSEIEIWNRELQHRVDEKTEALHRAQSEVAQTEKLAALGYLAAGMAHEIRNPLNSISLFSQLLSQGLQDPEQLEYLEKILKEVDRVDSIIRKLVDASRRSRAVTQNVQLDQIVDDALAVFAPQIEARKIIVSCNCTTPPPPLTADPTEIEQIFTNLFINALEEMDQGGTLHVDITHDDRRIVVKVADSGKGISSDVVQRIFEPFFTTKSRGTGIGLPVVQRIAKLYNGDVTVESTSATGTVFRVEFPVIKS
jgi:signal transduction histidine kinase